MTCRVPSPQAEGSCYCQAYYLQLCRPLMSLADFVHAKTIGTHDPETERQRETALL